MVRFAVKAEVLKPVAPVTPSARPRQRRRARLRHRPEGGSVVMAKSFHELSPRAQIDRLRPALRSGDRRRAGRCSIGPERAELETRAGAAGQARGRGRRACRRSPTSCPSLQREVRALEVALRETTAVIPDEKDPQDVLRNLHELASESSLDIASFKPKPIVAKAQYSEWPIQLGLEGSYHDLGRFFDRLATMSRLISVSDLDIKTKNQAERPRQRRGDVPGDDVRVQERPGADGACGARRTAMKIRILAFARRVGDRSGARRRSAQIPVGTRVGEPASTRLRQRRPSRPVRRASSSPKRPAPGQVTRGRPATGLASISVSPT